MYIIIWEYQIKPERQTEFEEIYSPHGRWVELFRGSQGYIGTELLYDAAHPARYLTIDRWASQEDYETFLSGAAEQYETLDAQCEGLTEKEALFGKWDSV